MQHWEKNLIEFLQQLITLQQEVLDILGQNQSKYATAKLDDLKIMQEQEKNAMQQLQKTVEQREQILKLAKEEQLPSENIETLGQHVFVEKTSEFYELLDLAKHQARHLQLTGMTNWLITQRSAIHYSQMLEIIATKGRNQSTYNRKHGRSVGMTGGAIVDRKA